MHSLACIHETTDENSVKQEMAVLDSNFNGIQHIGLPVTDMDRSKAFYVRLGFVPVMERPFEYNGDAGLCCMMKRGSVLMELYRMPPAELAEIRQRGNGHIDHIAFDVDDIDAAFAELKVAGFDIVEDEPAFIGFWEKGCKYFIVLGPDGERVEFNQIL